MAVSSLKSHSLNGIDLMLPKFFLNIEINFKHLISSHLICQDSSVKGMIIRQATSDPLRTSPFEVVEAKYLQCFIDGEG